MQKYNVDYIDIINNIINLSLLSPSSIYVKGNQENFSAIFQEIIDDFIEIGFLVKF